MRATSWSTGWLLETAGRPPSWPARRFRSCGEASAVRKRTGMSRSSASAKSAPDRSPPSTSGMSIPDLITLDIDLPYATGDELMLKIKTTEGWERVPVVMVTRKPKTVDTTWAVKSGARAYLVKPFKPEQLIECVGKLVAQQAG